MPKPKKQKPEPPAPLDPSEESAEVETVVAEPENGQHAETTEPVEKTEEPAKMKVQIEGTAGAVRAAARKVANAPQPPPVATPANDPEPPVDRTDELLSDPRNMVVVRRQLPKYVDGPQGRIRTSTKMPEAYSCPTSKEEIEADVFDNYGGYKYKCSIHPATTNGENTLLGAFTIEHPDGPDTMPIVEGLEQIEIPMDPRTSPHTRSGDETMKDTDPFKKLREDAERRLERAKAKKDAMELEAQAKRMEEEIAQIGKPVAPNPAAAVESDELRKLREQNARLEAALAEKKVNDRFDKLEDSIIKLTNTVATIAAGGAAKAGPSENDIILKMLTQSQQHSKDMLTMIQAQVKPAAPVEGEFDKFLNRYEKMQLITGTGKSSGGGSRLSELETRLIDMSVDRLMGGGGEDEGGGGGGDGVDVNDAIKTAIKEFGPIAKTYVEKTITSKQTENGGAPLSQEQMQQISADGAAFATKKVQEDLALQGLELRAGPENRLVVVPIAKKGVVPPRKENPGTRVVSQTNTPGGVVKKIAVEPTDLSRKTSPKPAAAPVPAAPEKEKEGSEVKYGEFPMLGENNTTLKIPLPTAPGDMKYNRKASVDFVLAGILSELRQGYPKKAENKQYVESFVAADAIEYLDDQLLNEFETITDGPQLEKLLQGAGGDAARIAEIKKAGEDEVVASYLRRTITTIQREWTTTKAQDAANK